MVAQQSKIPAGGLMAHDDHPVLLRGFNPMGTPSTAPVIYERAADDLMDSLFADIKQVPNKTLEKPPKDSILKLPIHQAFNVVIVDASCDVPGRPRLDPRKIVGGGLVLRRIAIDANGTPVLRNDAQARALPGKTFPPEVVQAWREGAGKAGWRRVAPGADDLDPDLTYRRADLRSGNGEIDRRLANWRPPTEPQAESFTPLFVAPPDVCAAVGKTLLYGIVQVSSAQRADDAGPTPTYNSDDFADHLHSALLGQAYSFSQPGAKMKYISQPDTTPNSLYTLVKQLVVEFGVLEDTSGAQALYARLNQIPVTYQDGRIQPAGDFINQASAVLLGPKIDLQMEIPQSWASSSGNDLRAKLLGAIQSRLVTFASREGRYEQEGRFYRLRAFVRVQQHEQCPPALYWSDYGDQFSIAPWYAGGATPPVRISLPGIDDFSNMKPGVAFSLPPGLFNLLQGDPNALIKGSGSKNGFKLGWICSFSIPIITLCAFIVLNIFLSLFDLIFNWMLYLKICIPIPTRSSDA